MLDSDILYNYNGSKHTFTKDTIWKKLNFIDNECRTLFSECRILFIEISDEVFIKLQKVALKQSGIILDNVCLAAELLLDYCRTCPYIQFRDDIIDLMIALLSSDTAKGSHSTSKFISEITTRAGFPFPPSSILPLCEKYHDVEDLKHLGRLVSLNIFDKKIKERFINNFLKYDIKKRDEFLGCVIHMFMECEKEKETKTSLEGV